MTFNKIKLRISNVFEAVKKKKSSNTYINGTSVSLTLSLALSLFLFVYMSYDIEILAKSKYTMVHNTKRLMSVCI